MTRLLGTCSDRHRTAPRTAFPVALDTLRTDPQPLRLADRQDEPAARRRPAAHRWVDDERAWRLRRALALSDAVALLLAFGVVAAVRAAGGHDGVLLGHLPLILLALPCWSLLAAGHDLYHLHSRRLEQGLGEELGSVLQMTVIWSWCVLLAAELTGIDAATVPTIALMWAAGTALLLGGRATVRRAARGRDWYAHRTLIVGAPGEARALRRKIERHPEYGLDVVGTVLLSRASPRRPAGAVPARVRPEEVLGLVKEQQLHRVILVSPPEDEAGGDRYGLARALGEHGVRVDLLPAWFEMLGTRLELHELEGTSLLTVPYVRLGRTALVVKRVFDVCVASLCLLAMLPLLLLSALAIKLDSPGPVLFRQVRIGRWGEPFEVLKFRSMKVGADAVKDQLADLNLHGGRGPAMFKIRRDPRVTRVGELLRRTSLDELPQLWNIVRGDMSLVGPRPLIEREARQVEGFYRRRSELTPGLTGLWQVNGRSEVPFEAMVNLDYLYVTTWSLWGDLKILIKTVPAVLARRGAY